MTNVQQSPEVTVVEEPLVDPVEDMDVDDENTDDTA
jgi:hypothetical protein